MLSNHPNLLGRGPTASSLAIGDVDGPSSSTDNALARFDGTTGKAIQNGVVTEDDYTGLLTGPINQSTTTAVGSAFTNQPTNDGVEILSASAADTTQTVTIIGTTTGTDTVVVETVTLTGTTPVSTVKVDWGVVLAVKKSVATAGTVTVRKATGDATITAGLTAAVLSVGVTTVTNTAMYNRVLQMVADGATTKQLGFQGTNTAGTVIYDSQALTGATVEVSNSSFTTLTEIYRGDLEVARTVTVYANSIWSLVGGQIGFPTGSASVPGIAFTANPDTGVYLIGSTIRTVHDGGDGFGFLLSAGVATLTFVQTGSIITAASGGALTIASVGTNQSVTITPSGTGAVVLKGTGTNDAAASTVVGELLSAQLAAASTTSLTTNTAKTIISISLTAGDWEVSGTVNFIPANTTVVAGLATGISATDNTQPAADSIGGIANSGAVYTSAGAITSLSPIPIRISIAATTTYYLVATAIFSVSTCTGYGVIRARRLR